MRRKCAHCNKILKGRADKKYCNLQCKNRYASQMRFQNLPIRQRIDRFLHRNHTILVELHEAHHHPNRWFVPRTKLQRLGFRFSNHTSIYRNAKGKIYHYIYDYRWMEFSDTMIMIVHNGKRMIETR